MKHPLYFKKHLCLLSLCLFFFNFNLNSQTKKEIRQIKKLEKKEKKINQLKNPNWLKIKDSIGYFTDDKDTYIESSSMESNSERIDKFINKDMNNFTERSSFKNDKESKIGTYILEQKIIQSVLFNDGIIKLIIEVKATCNNGVKSINKIIFYKKEIEAIKKANDVERFLKGSRFTTPKKEEKKLLDAIKTLCF
jgi:hypothetical protein